MKTREHPPETAIRSSDRPAVAGDGGGGDQGNRHAVRADFRLARRCLAGEVAAWEELYQQCHPPLLVAIEVMLRPYGSDRNLADVIAARVWYALIENEGRLLARFEPHRGARLITFLRKLAEAQISRYFRTEHRRRQREQIAQYGKSACQADDTQTEASLEEFLTTLTPDEQQFCEERLLADPSGGGTESSTAPSRTTAWRLDRRIREKLVAFFR